MFSLIPFTSIKADSPFPVFKLGRLAVAMLSLSVPVLGFTASETSHTTPPSVGETNLQKTKQSTAQNDVTHPNSPINNTVLAINTPVQTDDAVIRGAYVARAADCAGCHGENYAGGTKFVLPMGTVIATNITPSKTHGIGRYTLQQFSDAVRHGKTPSHQLYPAMPYPSYSRMGDSDLKDLYAYMQTIDAVDEAPKEKTHMNFPFNMRVLMKGYNLINVPKWETPANLSDSQKRGKYLVDNLGHCGDCHTPRTSTMGYDTSHYLAGAIIQGVEAPNITPDVETGIGSWSQQDIAKFLKTGGLQHQAIAGDEMGKVITYSTSHLTDNDLIAMADYLKSIPAVKSGTTTAPLNLAKLPQSPSEDMTYNLLKQIDVLKVAQSNAKPNSGESVYLDNCASCHGLAGQGQPEARYPAIAGLAMLRESEPKRLLHVIAHGSKAPFNTLPNMPAFADNLNDEQIAQVANYVRTKFGGLDNSQLTADEVKKFSEQKAEVPFLIANAKWLTIAGIVFGLLVLAGLVRWLSRRRR